jgi:cytochrome d ubiquinol oxidase subunit II
MLSPEQAAGAVAVAAIVMYTIFGGADFGGGIWTLLASGPRKHEQRNVLERAIGPVWETNHIWLILLVVTLFVVFPAAYAAIFTALYVPLFIALLGIVARGAAFALRHYGARESQLSEISLQAFSGASVLTPFAFGLSVGAVTGGHIKVTGTVVSSGAFAGWLQPFSIACGLIGLLICAFLTAAYMLPRTEGALQRDFRNRAIAASLALGAVTTAAIPIAYFNASEFSDELSRPSVLSVMAITACIGLATLAMIFRGRATLVPVFAAATATGVVLSWALAQNPELIAPGLSLQNAAAASITVKSFLIALAGGAVVLVPSLLLLYMTFSREVFAAEKPDVPGQVSH